MYAERLKNFTKLYDELSNIYGSVSVFMDFVKMFAISIHNSFNKNQEMEQEYLRTINSYEKKHHDVFAEMLKELIIAYEEADELTDILGPFYEKGNLSNSHLGQFFTPTHISDFMAEVSMEQENILKENIEKNGYITMNEPTCGAGGMILSFAKALKKRNINYQQNLLVEAIDISDVCAYMTYIQLALYGIPAIVRCGDSLSQKFRFAMETPLFFLQYWKFRGFYKRKDNDSTQENKIIIEKPIVKIAKNQDLKEVIVKGNCQISLW